MSTLRQIGIEYAKIEMVSDLVDEKLTAPATAEYEEEREFTVTLSMTLFSKSDVDTLRRIAAEPYGGGVEIHSSR